MIYRKIGKWGVKLSVIGLGSYLTIGNKIDKKNARDTIFKAYDGGVNFFDTADAYNFGKAEEVLGENLANFSRHTVFLLSKCWAPMSDDVNDRGLSAKHIMESCHKSLKRLKMDYLDLLMCHRPDPDTPLEETIRAMEDLARQGKIIYWGVSEWPAHLITRANRIAADIGARPITVSEPRYNLLYRYPERSLFAATDAEGIGNVVFSPLAHGMLTGKYKPGEDAPKNTRAANKDTNPIMMSLYWSEANKVKCQELGRIASEIGISVAQLSLGWCLKNSSVTSAITGATKVSQIDDNLKAADIEIPDDVMQKLDKLFPTVDKAENEGK